MHPKLAEITVAAIAAHEDRFLCIEERVRGVAVITQPAGHVEPGESLLDAVRRETLEESGHLFEPEAVSGIYVWRQPRSGATMVRVNFIGRAHGYDPHRPLDRGVLRSLWLSHAELVAREARLRNPLVLRGVNDFLAGKRYPLELLHTIDSPWHEEKLAI